MKWLIAVLIISILIVFHEFGHYIAARINGVTVEEFSLGYGPRLLSVKKGDTRFSLKLLFIGGSCRMKGMIDDPEERKEAAAAATEGSFLSVSVGRRIAIVLAGPVFNFILAFICAVIVLSVVGYDPAVVLDVPETSPAYEAGLRKGDLIESFMGQHVDIGRDLSAWFIFDELKAGEEVNLTVIREGEKQTISYIPDSERRYMLGFSYHPGEDSAVIDELSIGYPLEEKGVRAGDVITSINGVKINTADELEAYFKENPVSEEEIAMTLTRSGHEYSIAVTPIHTDYVQTGFVYNLYRFTATPLQVLKYAFIEIRYWIGTVLKSIAAMFTGRFSVNDLSGPVGIADAVGSTYEETKSEGLLMTLMNMINLMIMLSANLGVVNLLPIPGIDGGRLLFLLLEAVRGKPVSQRIELGFQAVAALLLIILMVFVMWNDVHSLFGP